jgi:DNA-binding beta-propeller fold protein YncE
MQTIFRSVGRTFPFHRRSTLRYCGGLLAALAWMAWGAAQAQTTICALGTTALLVGPSAGTNSVVLAVAPATGAWTATANAAWLHLDAANQSGTGSTNVVFSYDANPGGTRTGALAIAGQTLTVTQAGSTYVAAQPLTTLASTGLHIPEGVAVGNTGAVYIADSYNFEIKEWTPANNAVIELSSLGTGRPQGIAVDGAGNVYFAEIGVSTIFKWTAADGTVAPSLSYGLSDLVGLALDGAGNVYIADEGDNAVKKWSVMNSLLTTLTSSGLNSPAGVAVDGAGNVYIADTGNGAIKEWAAASQTVSTLVASGLSQPQDVAVDGSGNIYIDDRLDNAIKMWSAASQSVTTLLSSGLSNPTSLAVDGTGNVFIADAYDNAIKELPYAFVDPTPVSEGSAAGHDSLPAVLPATANLLAPFAPGSDQSWLTISGITNGVVSFSFTADPGSSRVAHITLLGQTIPILQYGAKVSVYSLGATARLEGPAAGSDSVVLGVTPAAGMWIAAANVPWLHLPAASQSGTGSTNLVFSYEANPGGTRTGTLTIAGQTLTVTQAGSTYVVADPVTPLVSSNLSNPYAVAVDGAGNVYIADSGNNAIKKWTKANNTVTTLVSSGLTGPNGVAVDGAGNVYISGGGYSAIQKWTKTNSTLTTLVSAGVILPSGVAVDGAGNVYFTDQNGLKKWSAASLSVTTLVSTGLSRFLIGLAVDVAGNVYIDDSGNNAVKKWTAANSNLTTLVSSNLNGPEGVAVDGAGNVFISDCGNNAIKEWVAANNTVTTLVSSGLHLPHGLAVDGAGNVYIADTGNNASEELPYAFVDPNDRLEGMAAGTDAIVILPATANLLAPFAPASQPSWLAISGITNGAVNFTYPAASAIRRGFITLLGQAVPVTQGVPSYSVGSTPLLEGPAAGSDSLVLSVYPNTLTWTNTANAAWLHLTAGNQSGTGSTNVVFSYDANPGATRTGDLTVAGQTFTVTQADSTYVAVSSMTALVPSGLDYPCGVAVDISGNVYIVDSGHNAIQKWTKANNTVTTLVSSGLNYPVGVAVDAAGDVYIANGSPCTIMKWTAANSNVTTIVSSGLDGPSGLAVDSLGNVYIADADNGTIKKWTATNGNMTTLVSSGLSFPASVAVDIAGNVYIADAGNGEILEWTAANGNVTTLVSSGLNHPYGLAVDGAGNVYVADTFNNAIKKWAAASGNLTTLVSLGLNSPQGLAVDGSDNIYSADTGNGAIKELPYAFLDPTDRLESLAAGNDALVVLPATINLLAPFTPACEPSWLAISGISNGVVNFSFAATAVNRTAFVTLLGQAIPVTQGGPSYSLSASAFLEGPAAGSDSVLLTAYPNNPAWTNTANASWLHLSPANQSGAGGTNVIFSYDANPGATRTGTLTIAGQSLTITQAGSTYVAVGLLPLVSSGLNAPSGVAVDGVGNVYIADTSNNVVKEWTLASNTVTTLVSSGLSDPTDVALDGAGNIYIANYGGTIGKWTAATSNLTTLVSGLSGPQGVAVDGAGNVYMADTGHNAIKEWMAANSYVVTLPVVLPFAGLEAPYGLAVDGADNVYFTQNYDSYDYGGTVGELIGATDSVNTLATALDDPAGLALDSNGNVYFTTIWEGLGFAGGGFVYEWMVANNSATLLASWTVVTNAVPYGVAVDAAGNLYVADSGNNEIMELPHAFVDPTARSEKAGAGNDALPAVLPGTANLTGPFIPTSNQPWLTISGVTNGVVSFSFAANPGSSRAAQITLLGQTITITQAAASFSLGTTALLEGPAAGSNSVVLAPYPNIAPWTNSANASWLHLSAANQTGTGSTNVVFSFDANSGATRSGTLTIASHTLTVTQAGSNYVAAGSAITLVSAGLNQPSGVAVDGAGNVYIADTGNSAIKEWRRTNNTVAALVSSGLNRPQGLAVDGAGNVYIADTGHSVIEEWTAANSHLATLVSSGLDLPYGVALDSATNVYIADTGHNVIEEWSPASGNLTALVSSGLDSDSAVAVDAAGNVYIADTGDSAIQEWTAANGAAAALVSSGLNAPAGVAVDGAGNVCFADSGNNAIKEWTGASGAVTPLVSSGLNDPSGVAVDAAGNIYIADTGDNAIKELPRAFVIPAARSESAAAGNDALPAVLPATANLLGPFTPASDQTWLTISGVSNGVVSFLFAANIGPSRTANITLLGQTIAITQGAPTYALGTNVLAEGANAGSDSVALNVIPQIAAWTNTANAAWLNLSLANQTGAGSTNVVFSFDANAGTTRTGTLTIAGQTLTVTQAGASYTLGTNTLQEGANAGSDSVVLTVIPQIAPWTNTANATWLHLSLATQTGTGSTNVAFSFDANPGLLRAGTLTIAGQTLTITQAGASYILGTTVLVEGLTAGSDSVVLTVVPQIAGWTATANAAWLHLAVAYQSGTGSATVVFSFDANPGVARLGTLTIGGQTLTVTQGGGQSVLYGLGTSALLEGPAAGSGSVVLAVSPNFAAWTATTNAAWLHLTPANQTGVGGANVVFSYDANTGVTRSGTLMIGGQTLTVTQAGSTYVAAGPVTTLLSSGLNQPGGVAVDGAGNVYIANTGSNIIEEWTVANNTVTTLVSSGFSRPSGVAVDGAGNVYFANYGSNTIEEWMPANNTVTTLVSSNLSQPVGVAVDGAGNVYFANSGSNTIQKWTAANGNVTTLASSGLSNPYGVAVDGAGNVYIPDMGHNAVKEWTAANSNLTTLVSSGLSLPNGVAVDGAGNLYISCTYRTALTKWTAANSNLTQLASGLYEPYGVAMDGAGNVYIADTGNSAIKELPYAFVDPTPRWESSNAAGSDALPVVLPATENLLPPFAPASDQPWLTIGNISNGVVTFAFAATTSYRTGNITLLGQTIPVRQGAPSYALGTAALLEGPNAGTDSVVLAVIPNFAPWTAAANSAWLHLALPSQSGAGSTNVVFSYDANPGATRTATLTIAGLALTVTQAGSTYVAADPVTTLVSSNLSSPNGVAVDAAGNVYIADSSHSAIREWMVANNTVTTLVSSGLSGPNGVAVDGAGNVYIADTFNNAIKKWTPANSNVTTLMSSGLWLPYAVAVDGAGNIYIADSGHSAIKEWTAANSNVTTLVSSGLNGPDGVAVDRAGNVYIADSGNSAIKEWTAANSNVTTLVSSGLSSPYGVAVDGAGNVCIADTGHNMVKKWTAASSNLTTLVSAGLNSLHGVAVDGAGNVFFADSGNNAVKELPCAFVDPTDRLESLAGGSDAIVVLPATANLLAPFAPASVPSWLAISGVTNGVVSFSFAAAAFNRTAFITLLGQTIPVTQGGPSYSLGATALLEGPYAGTDAVALSVYPTNLTWTNTANASWLHLSLSNQSGAGSTNVVFSFDLNPGAARSGTLTIAGQTVTVTQGAFTYSLGTAACLEGPTAGSNSVVLAVSPNFGPWTATANAPWLHLSLANQGGSGSTNVVFSYDANPGATRTGTLTIAGQSLAVTQAGSTYIAAAPVTTLVSSGLQNPCGLAVDGAGNVYIADTSNDAIKEWTATNNLVTTLVSSGLSNPRDVAVDSAGNVYIADTTLLEWNAALGGNLVSLASFTDATAHSVAVDGAGNLYIGTSSPDAGFRCLYKWTGANTNVITLVRDLGEPDGVAVDAAGNAYIADAYNMNVLKWTAANSNLTALVPSGLSFPEALAVDGAGNVYIADSNDKVIKKWTAANNTMTTLPFSGLSYPQGVAVDGAGNVYVANTLDSTIEELPCAFVDATPRLEGMDAGNDALSMVLPATVNLSALFAPTSDQPWLTITGVTNGVVGFSFAANTGPARTANITLLGQTIPVTQGVIGTPPILAGVQMLGNGVCQLCFSNTPGASFTVLSTTNLSLPLVAWMVVGTCSNTAPSQFQFTSQPTTNDSQRFYIIRSP